MLLYLVPGSVDKIVSILSKFKSAVPKKTLKTCFLVEYFVDHFASPLSYLGFVNALMLEGSKNVSCKN